jgi:hypothetical protein
LLYCPRVSLDVMVSGSGAEFKDPCRGVGAAGDVIGGPS